MNRDSMMIAIVDGDQPVQERPCRLVDLPDGRCAALWRGLVWPVIDGQRIDIAGPAYPLLARQHSATARFGLIDGAEEAWLILDGSVVVRDAAVQAMRQAGIVVLRSGPWLGDAVDDVAGTSFIRFAKPAGADLRQKIGAILEGSIVSAGAEPEPADQVRVLTVELLAVRAELARLKLAHAEQQPSAPSGVETELIRARQENLELLGQIADLGRRLAEAGAARPRPSRSAGRLHEEIAAFMTALRPDLRLLRDSLTVLAGEFADRCSFYRAILELESDPLPRGWKQVRTAQGWRERHVSNGQDDSGRVYARCSNGTWDLLISHKSQQARDIGWLARDDARTRPESS